MTTTTLFDFMREVPTFSGLTDADLSALVRECGVIDLETGAFLFKEGANGDAAYVVQSGQI